MTKKHRPAKPAAPANVISLLTAPEGLSEAEQVEFDRLVDQHGDRLSVRDTATVTQLARLRCAARAMAARLDREGPMVVSGSGAKKKNPALAALTALESQERALTRLLGLQRADVSVARQQMVAKERIRQALTYDEAFRAEGGDCLAGWEEWSHQPAADRVPGRPSPEALRVVMKSSRGRT